MQKIDKLSKLYVEMQRKGIKPWVGIKALLQIDFLKALYQITEAEDVVLQGGGALHFVYNSPRLSVNLDFAHKHPKVDAIISLSYEKLKEYVSEDLGIFPELEIVKSEEKFLRAKILIETGKAQHISCNLEFYEIPCYQTGKHPLAEMPSCIVMVEEPSEILADKLVANLDRMRRGFLKMRDLYDIWYIKDVLNAQLPDTQLAYNKFVDYKIKVRTKYFEHLEKKLLKPETIEELGAALKGFLPDEYLERMDLRKVLHEVKDFFQTYRGVYDHS